MININTNTNTAIFQNKEFEIVSKKINDFESVNIELKDRGILYFLNSDVVIDGKEFYEEYFDLLKLTINQLNEMQYNELQLTDWCFIRKSELGIEVPQEILDERDSIRKKYNDLKANVK